MAQTGIRHNASPQHQVKASRLGAGVEGVLHIPNFAIGHQRRFHLGFDVGNAMPVRGWALGIGLGAGVHHDLTRTTGLERQGACFCGAVIVEP